MTLWWLLRVRLALWLLRAAARAARWAALAAVIVVFFPVAVVAGLGMLAAWLRGWPPSRLLRASAGSLVITVVWLAAHAVTAGSGRGFAAGLAGDFTAAWHGLLAGRIGAALVLTAPAAIPAGLAAAGLLWAWRIYAIETGLAGQTATAMVTFDARQWHRAARAAAGRVTVPGTVPLADGRGRVVTGAVIRTVGHRWHPVLALPWQVFGRHQVIIGASGTGKTNLMMRTWAGWYAAARRAGARPLLVVLDCKGGPDARVKAERTRRLLHAAGAARVAVWPDETSLSLWHLPPAPLAVVLFQMVETGAGSAAFYGDVLQAAVTLAVSAPRGPPRSAAQFLSRLEPGWLEQAWAGHPAEQAAARAARPHLADAALRYRTLLGRLGPGFDGPGELSLQDSDAWYCMLEGTAEPTVAEAQALALTELVAHLATANAAPASPQPRAVLLACDDYSAVAGKVPLWLLCERGRSLGIGVQVSAQSWHGLGPTDADRYRITAAADGGIWLLRTPHPQPVTELAGTRRVVETATKVIGGMWGDEGSSRIQHAWTADPGIARRLAVGQAGYIHAGGCTWITVARPVPSPPALPAAPASPPGARVRGEHPVPAAEPAAEAAPPADQNPLADVFGQEIWR
jgi:hypothetical protein